MLINTINKHLFNSLIHVTHWLTENPARNRLGAPVLRALVALTLQVKGGRRQESVEAAAQEWQTTWRAATA